MPHGLQSRTSTTVALAATVGLVLTACSSDAVDDDVAAPEETASAPATPDDETTSTPSEDDTPSDGASPSDGTSPSGDDAPSDGSTPILASYETPELDAECVLEPEQFEEVTAIRYAVPSDWRVEGRCDILDPDLEELPDQTEVDAAMFVSVANVEFGVTRESQEASRDRTSWLGARANFQAVRDTYVGTGAAQSEDGQPGTSWVYDLDAGTDEQGGVLTMSTGDVEGEDEYRLAQATLDTIAQTVVIEPPAESADSSPGATEFAILRTEGGGTPFAVTYDGNCFAFRPGGPTNEASDELCDLEPTDGDIVAGQVGDTVVGYAPPTTIAVQSDDVSQPYGLATSIEGGTVFALPTDEVPSTLTAIGPGGEELITADVG